MPSDTIRVMVSSRVKTEFVGVCHGAIRSLGDLRQALKLSLEDLRLGDRPVFKVWLNEEEPASGINATTWVQECLDQVERAQIVIVLFSGEAGTVGPGAGLGICRAEFDRARSSRSGLNYYFDVSELVTVRPSRDEGKRNDDFASSWHEEELYAPRPRDVDHLLHLIRNALCDQVILNAGHFLRRVSSPVSTIELAWAALPYQERRERLLDAGSDELSDTDRKRQCVLNIDGSNVLVRLHCSPDALSVARAREELGRPHLDDLSRASTLTESRAIGPINLILIRGSATLAQARNLIGDPDAFVIKTPFGAWASERTYGAQMGLVAGCLDTGSTRQQVQSAIEWITRRNAQQVIQNARRRAAICGASSATR